MGQAAGPFFRDTSGGARFCLLRLPSRGDVRGAVLAVHPFAEELNKTRAAMADGARALAAAGYAVLQIDLAGCGDSDGAFDEATWATWLLDLDDAWRWLANEFGAPQWLWGTRFGALLADAFASNCDPAAEGLLLWQPVVSGAQHLNQFLRLKTVGSLLQGARKDASAPVGASVGPRDELAAGTTVEIAGYALAPSLATAIDAAALGSAAVPKRVRWLDVSARPGADMNPASQRVIDQWRAAGSDVVASTVAGPAFWQTVETERNPALVDATVASMS